MFGRRLEVLLPADLSDREYAALTHAVWGLLNATGIGAVSALRPDGRTSDAEMNAAFDDDVATYPWSHR